MLVAAVLVIVDAVRLPETSEAVGPAAVPLPVGVLLGVVGAALLVQARAQLRDRVARNDVAAAGRTAVARDDRRAGGVRGAAAGAGLRGDLGSAVRGRRDVAWGAEVFGSTVAYGWALAAIVFLVFDRLIGLSLPTGPWGF